MNFQNKQVLEKKLSYNKKQCVSQPSCPPGKKHNFQDNKV